MMVQCTSFWMCTVHTSLMQSRRFLRRSATLELRTFVPGGCTSLVQPIDAAFNKPFNSAVDGLATTHMQENLDAYVTGGMDASRC